jgi:hypothetical protein
LKGFKNDAIDHESLVVLSGMKQNAFSVDSDDAELYAIMYCGALYFARERRLINKNVAKHFLEQFRKDFEKISETPAREESEK